MDVKGPVRQAPHPGRGGGREKARVRGRGLLALAFLCLLSGSPAPAGEAARARAVVDRAIAASGGEANLARYKAASWKEKGTVRALGNFIPYSGESARQGADRKRSTVEGEVNKQKFKFLLVVDGRQGWVQLNGATRELTKEQLAEEKEQMYAEHLARLASLQDRAVRLTLLGETRVGDAAAIGLKATGKDHRPVDLFFDKKTGLLLKVATRVKDGANGKEAEQETLYSNYKEIQGVKVPLAFSVLRDGKPYVEGQASDYHLEETLDDSVFARP